MYEISNNQINENAPYNQTIFENKPSYPINDSSEFTQPYFIRKETTLIREKSREMTDENIREYFMNKKSNTEQIEWLTIANTKVNMINFNVISKIHVTGKSQFHSYYSSFTSFEPKKANSSIEIFANSMSEFNHCYFHDSISSAVVVRDFSQAKFTNCVFEKNKISVFITNNSYVEFENCIFMNDINTSIFCTKKSDIKIKNCQFKNVNKSIFCKDEINMRIEDCNFIENKRGIATISIKSKLMMKNITINDTLSTAIRATGNSIVQCQNVLIKNTKGNAINLENSNGYFFECKMIENTEFPTIAIKGIKSNPIFSNCEVIDNGESFAVVIKNCSRPLFDKCLFTNCESNCFSISDFSMPLIRDCEFKNIQKYWLNIYGNSIVALSGDYSKISTSKNSMIINENEIFEKEKEFIEQNNENERKRNCLRWKPSGYKNVPNVENLSEPEEIKNLKPLSFISIEKVMQKQNEINCSLKCYNHQHHHEDEELFVSAQCGHCFCEQCLNHKKCPVCDTPVLKMNKVFVEDQCVICLDRASTTIITSCGHMCMCYECAMKCYEDNFKCPLCNQPITGYRYMSEE